VLQMGTARASQEPSTQICKGLEIHLKKGGERKELNPSASVFSQAKLFLSSWRFLRRGGPTNSVLFRSELLSPGRGTTLVLTGAQPPTQLLYSLQVLRLCQSTSCGLACGEETSILSLVGSSVKLDASCERSYHI